MHINNKSVKTVLISYLTDQSDIQKGGKARCLFVTTQVI